MPNENEVERVELPRPKREHMKQFATALHSFDYIQYAEFKRYADVVEAENATLRKERDALQAFKVYVHKRLDEASVPVDPPSSHREQGCRIGGRLDIALAAESRVTELTEALRELRDALKQIDEEADMNAEEQSSPFIIAMRASIAKADALLAQHKDAEVQR